MCWAGAGSKRKMVVGVLPLASADGPGHSELAEDCKQSPSVSKPRCPQTSASWPEKGQCALNTAWGYWV